MRVLVACEFSGIVRDAFLAEGHDAYSCDLIPSERPGPHIQDNVAFRLTDKWDLMIAFPPCTYLCSMGLWWNKKRPERIPQILMQSNIHRIAIENPVGCIGTRIRKADQLIQPWQFGHEANKPTCLWLKNLPPLVPTNVVGRGKFYTKANGARMSAWSHITSGTRKEERARIASRTFPGIAKAMAEQWGNPFMEEERYDIEVDRDPPFNHQLVR